MIIQVMERTTQFDLAQDAFVSSIVIRTESPRATYYVKLASDGDGGMNPEDLAHALHALADEISGTENN